MVNPNADAIVLPCFACVGSLVPVSAVSVALAEPVLPGEVKGTLPDHLEDIVTGSHPLWGRPVRCCSGTFSIGTRMFSQPGGVTGHATSVQHEIVTSDARPVRCVPFRLAPAWL